MENHLVFVVGGRTLASKMIEGQFPAFEKVIALTGDKVVALARERLATAIRRVSLLSSERSRAVRLSASARASSTSPPPAPTWARRGSR